MEEKYIDWLVACMCRGFAEYDANEIMQHPTDSADRDCQDRHLSSREG